MKHHLPYNVLLVAAVIAMGLMAVFNLSMRQSNFAVRVGYALPAPTVADTAPPVRVPEPPSPPTQPAYTPEPAQQYQPEIYEPIVDQEPIVLVRFPLELNAATYEQLQFITGIGPVTAGNIIALRNQLGGFTYISQLLDVRGVGPTTFYRITAYLYLENQLLHDLQPDEGYDYDEDDFFYDQAQYYD